MSENLEEELKTSENPEITSESKENETERNDKPKINTHDNHNCATAAKTDTTPTLSPTESSSLTEDKKATVEIPSTLLKKEETLTNTDSENEMLHKEDASLSVNIKTALICTKDKNEIDTNPLSPKGEKIKVNKEEEEDLTTTKETPSSKDDYAEHVTYTEDGTAIYTDPKTNYQYKWCTKENKWIPKDSTTSNNPYENEHYKWCSATNKWLPKQTQVTETEHYKWDGDKNEWVAKVKDSTPPEQITPTEIVYEIDEDGQRTYTDKDGTVFFWDADKNAWFPKIDEDFMARYQMSYGFIDNTSESVREKEQRDLKAHEEKEKELAKMMEEAKANEEAKQGVKRKGQQEPPKWFEINPEHNTKVYVSNLPLDITLDEFTDVMGKCGMIMRDPQTQKYKLKLYTEADGQIKGDGLCDYIKVESVDLALKILDEYDLRGHKLRVQRAQFQMRGEYNPALKPKRKKKDKEKLAKIKEKLFDWRPEKMRGERSKHEKTVIIKNLFHPDLFEKEVQLILDYQNDLREECSKCGSVRKVVVYDRHSEGVAQINMSSPEEADLVIQMMSGRFFGKRQLTAEHWDGKTKYKIEETEEEIQKRLNKWDQYLENKNPEENKKPELQQEETDIEKTINFESVDKSKDAQKQQEPESQQNTDTRTEFTHKAKEEHNVEETYNNKEISEVKETHKDEEACNSVEKHNDQEACNAEKTHNAEEMCTAEETYNVKETSKVKEMHNDEEAQNDIEKQNNEEAYNTAEIFDLNTEQLHNVTETHNAEEMQTDTEAHNVAEICTNEETHHNKEMHNTEESHNTEATQNVESAQISDGI